MNKTLIALTILGTLSSTQALGKTYGIKPVKLTSNQHITEQTVSELIQFLQPSLSDSVSKQIAVSVLKYSRDINLDWRLFISILYQESSLTMDPQGCYKNELHPPLRKVKTKTGFKMISKPLKKCIDYGIAQINFHTWGEELDLDKERLLTDIDYSINAASKILFYYKHRFSKKDRRWHLRYHSSTPSLKDGYGQVIGKRFNKINGFMNKGDSK